MAPSREKPSGQGRMLHLESRADQADLMSTVSELADLAQPQANRGTGERKGHEQTPGIPLYASGTAGVHALERLPNPPLPQPTRGPLISRAGGWEEQPALSLLCLLSQIIQRSINRLFQKISTINFTFV